MLLDAGSSPALRKNSSTPEIINWLNWQTGQTGFDGKMWTFLDKIPIGILLVVAILMLLAPFRPMPHVLEKLIMLKNGTLTRPIDIFDLIFHLIPTALLILKIFRNWTR
jgi:hypothetical protein